MDRFQSAWDEVSSSNSSFPLNANTSRAAVDAVTRLNQGKPVELVDSDGIQVSLAANTLNSFMVMHTSHPGGTQNSSGTGRVIGRSQHTPDYAASTRCFASDSLSVRLA